MMAGRLWLCMVVAVYGEHIPSVDRIPDIPQLLRNKTELLSVYVNWDTTGNCPPFVRKALDKGIDVFFAPSGHPANALFNKAFSPYRFTLILPSNKTDIEPAIVHAIWRHTVPIYNGKFDLSLMFGNGVVAWNESGNIDIILNRVKELNQKIRFLWSYQQILQEVIWYRFGARELVEGYHPPSVSHSSKLAVVGIYSAVANWELRQAIRSTWGRMLRTVGFEVLFFLSTDTITVAREQAQFGDIIALPVRDGYRNNSRKGVLFLKWMAKNRADTHKYLIKTDDDIFWRPTGLIDKLRNLQNTGGYIWGFMDYISPVPRNTSDPFYNSPELYPFPTFPTYPRGLVRVVSMDIVAAIAHKAERKELRMIQGDDPCFGVHLRQIVDLVPSIVIDDFDSYTRFAMEPTCHQSAWRPVTNSTWVVHHVTAKQITCLHATPFPNCNCFD